MKHNEPLTLAAARAHFRAYWLPTLRSSDRASIRLAWSQYIDALHRERRISDKQVNTWDIPANFGLPRKAARKNPSACGCRSNPSKARKPKRTTKKATRAARSNPAVECSASPKRDRYRAAKVMHQGEWVQNGGCWDAKGVPSYVGKGESGKRRVIAKKVVRQKASRTPKFVKGARVRKAR